MAIVGQKVCICGILPFRFFICHSDGVFFVHVFVWPAQGEPAFVSVPSGCDLSRSPSQSDQELVTTSSLLQEVVFSNATSYVMETSV